MGIIPRLEARVEKQEVRNESLTDEVAYLRQIMRNMQEQIEQLELVLFSMMFDGRQSQEVEEFLRDPTRNPIIGLALDEKLDRLKALLNGKVKTQDQLEREYEQSIYPDRPLN